MEAVEFAKNAVKAATATIASYAIAANATNVLYRVIVEQNNASTRFVSIAPQISTALLLHLSATLLIIHVLALVVLIRLV